MVSLFYFYFYIISGILAENGLLTTVGSINFFKKNFLRYGIPVVVLDSGTQLLSSV